MAGYLEHLHSHSFGRAERPSHAQEKRLRVRLGTPHGVIRGISSKPPTHSFRLLFHFTQYIRHHHDNSARRLRSITDLQEHTFSIAIPGSGAESLSSLVSNSIPIPVVTKYGGPGSACFRLFHRLSWYEICRHRHNTC